MAYSLSHSYFGASFVSDFNWINYADPSNGFVKYQSQPDALSKGLYSIDPATQAVTLGVDHTNVYGLGEGRPSLRLESKQVYNFGLFIGDFAHMPSSVCGLWPAFWMYGPNWPTSGEIDIIEGANQVTKNIISGHTTPGCSLPSTPATSGQALFTDCTSPGTNNNAGCNYLPPASDSHTYGDSFNAVGGGVYALDWTEESIRIWHWPRQSIPADIKSKKPDPSTWGLPTALFGTSTCEVDKYFKDMSIVIQTNFCGDYAGNIWGQGDDTCNQRAPTCVEYVAKNPGAFENAYWEVNYIDVYECGATNNTSTAAPQPTTTTTVRVTSTVFTTVPNPATLTQNGTILISTTIQSVRPSVSTAPASPSTDPLVPERQPATIEGYAFLGCYGSVTGFRTFSSRASAGDMTLRKCVNLCSPEKYAGVHESECFCADELDPDTRAEADRLRCNIPCPGNSTERCGGNENSSPVPSRLMHMHLHRRAAPASYLLTIYGRVTDETPPPAPPLGDPEPHTPSTSTVVTTVTYTTVIDGSMGPTEHATTILVPGCSKYCGSGGQPNAVSVPMVTTVVPCNACGPHGENDVTITVPLQIAAAPVTTATTGYWPSGGPVTATPPGAATPHPSVASINSAPDLHLGWPVCVGVAIAMFRFVLMFV